MLPSVVEVVQVIVLSRCIPGNLDAFSWRFSLLLSVTGVHVSFVVNVTQVDLICLLSHKIALTVYVFC